MTMPNSVFFSKNKRTIKWITYTMPMQRANIVQKHIKFIVPVVLIMAMAVGFEGCAANKCDCPKFAGHHLAH